MKNRKEESCPDCSRADKGLALGEGFSRRRFLQIGATGLVASWFADVVDPKLLFGRSVASNVSLRKTAKSCIFIFLPGAPSQIDMWDLKEGAWTPADFAPTSFFNNTLRFPQGLMPKTAAQLDKMTIVRSGLAWAAVHSLGQTWAQIARNPGGATGAIAPHIGAVVSIESQMSRSASDVLPGFIALNSGSIPGSGYLAAKYAPFGVTTAATGLATLSHPEGATRFADRWSLLHTLDQNRTTAALGKGSSDMNDFYDQSKALMEAPGINALFSFSDTDHAKYGSSTFGDSLIVARNLVTAKRGTRFVQATFGGWDHHSGIYAKTGSSLYTQNAAFDPALGALLADLAAMPGSAAGTSALDETMVVIVAEFGRTVGALNNQAGRDHFLRNSYVFAGGGTRGGRVLGKTNAAGDKVDDYGWSGNRDVRPEDVTSTIYSALGIDYTTIRHDDPLNRGFEYVPFASDGLYGPLEDLW
jgi:hypothetical protein